MKGIKKILIHKESGIWIAQDSRSRSRVSLPSRLVTIDDVRSYYEDLFCLIPYMLFFV